MLTRVSWLLLSLLPYMAQVAHCQLQVQTPLLDERLMQDSVPAGGSRDYTFDVRDVQLNSNFHVTPTTVQPDLIRLQVSPCNGGNSLKWELLHDGEQTYEFSPEDPANNNNIQDNRMVALGKRRKRRQSSSIFPLPQGFQYERTDPDEFTGLGSALRPQTGFYQKSDASDGRYTLRLRNQGREPIEYTAFLSRREKQSVVPELPDIQNVKVDRVRPTSIQISWRPVHGAGANSGIDYVVQAFPLDRLQTTDNVNSACGVKRLLTRLGNNGVPQPFSTNGRTSAMFNDLRANTRYQLNVLATNSTSRADVAYLAVEASTSHAGMPLPLERDVGNITLPANHRQIFTLDLTTRSLSPGSASTPLGVTVFPCDGLVTWSMTRDGIEQQAFETTELGSDSTGGSISDSDSDESDSNDDRRRRQDNDNDNDNDEEEEKEEADTPDMNQRETIQRQQIRPMPAGAGVRAQTGGQTVFTYNEQMTEPALYQLTVYNTANRPIRFDLYASSRPARERPFPVLPADPQVKAVAVDGNTADFQWYPSVSNDPLSYCISATPTRQLSPQFVQSSTCGLRQAPIYTPPPPAPNAPLPGFANPGPGVAPAQPGFDLNFPNAPTQAPRNNFGGFGQPQPAENTISLPGAEIPPPFEHPINTDQFPTGLMPLVQRTRGCGTDTRGRLTQLSAGTEYNVEVLAVNMRTNRPMAYTSALVHMSGSQMIQASVITCLLAAVLIAVFNL